MPNAHCRFLVVVTVGVQRGDGSCGALPGAVGCAAECHLDQALVSQLIFETVRDAHLGLTPAAAGANVPPAAPRFFPSPSLPPPAGLQ